MVDETCKSKIVLDCPCVAIMTFSAWMSCSAGISYFSSV